MNTRKMNYIYIYIYIEREREREKERERERDLVTCSDVTKEEWGNNLQGKI